MKNKKIVSGLIVGVLAGVNLFTLSACGANPDSHVHAYHQDLHYTIENGQVYSHKECDCGEVADRVIVENAIIANPDNAQSVIDGDINNKVVVFDGLFTEKLLFRPTLLTAEVYSLADENEEGVENVKQWRQATLLYKAGLTEEVNGVLPLESGTLKTWTEKANRIKYNYVRHLENVVLTSTKGSEFQNGLKFISTHASTSSSVTYDPLREEDVTAVTTQQFWQHLNINNLTFNRLNFKTVIKNQGQETEEKQQAQILIYDDNTATNTEFKINELHDISVTSCTFKDPTFTDSTESNAAVYIQTGRYMNDRFVNFVYKNNVVDGNFQGVHIKNVDGAIFKGNKISNTNSNAIACQSSSQTNENIYATGRITIEDNVIVNVHDNYHTLTGDEATTVELGGDRPFRFGRVKNAQIIIKNNKITDCYMQYLAIQKFGESSSCLAESNTYNGEDIKDSFNLGTLLNEGLVLYIPGYPIV